MKWENWESPINIIATNMRTEFEGEIMKAIQEVGISVDKKELIKCMQYDREQYDKGYEQGRADAIDEIKELAQQYLIGMMDLENATKYGNKNANQQDISYGTLMRYEIADCVDDFIDSIEQLKEQQ